jgi:hypothetical protein
MNQYRFALDKSSKKHVCPSCEKRRFVRYMDTDTGEYLSERYGRCDREAECSYHKRPYQKQMPVNEYGLSIIAERKPPPSIPDFVLNGTLRNYKMNNFVKNLSERIPYPFDQQSVDQVCNLYKIGTIRDGYMAGAVTFPYIDIDGVTRAIQIRQYDKNNHGTKTTFVHSLLKSHFDKLGQVLPDWLSEYMKSDSVVSCLFGEHLLKAYPDRPVNIVEAPKTAIIATLYFGHPDTDPDVPIWLASFNLSALNFARCKVLRSRKVTLFPDLSVDGTAFRRWKSKAVELSELVPSSRWMVSRMLEDSTSSEDRVKGADIADYLVKLDWREIRQGDKGDTLPMTPTDAADDQEECAFVELMQFFELCKHEGADMSNNRVITGKPIDLPDEIADLQMFFDTCTFPATPFRLDGAVITDCDTFTRAHISFLRTSKRAVYKEPYLKRLRRLKAFMEATGSDVGAPAANGTEMVND